MRYTHSFHLIRRRKHVFKISLVLTLLAIALVLFLGFTELDARQFFFGFLESLSRATIAYLFALFLAVSAALIVTSKSTIEEIAIPILDALQSFPAFAVLPLMMVWFGRTDGVVIVILIFEMFWPILFTLLSAQKQLRSELLEAGQAFGAHGFNLLRFVVLPLLFPALVTGSIVAWGEAWETIIAAEIIVNLPGVGSYLSSSHTTSQVLMIGTFLLLVILFLLNKYIWLPLLNISTKYQQD